MFAEFDKYCDEHPELEPPEAFAQWLCNESGNTVIGRKINDHDIIVAIPDADQEIGRK